MYFVTDQLFQPPKARYTKKTKATFDDLIASDKNGQVMIGNNPKIDENKFGTKENLGDKTEINIVSNTKAINIKCNNREEGNVNLKSHNRNEEQR